MPRDAASLSLLDALSESGFHSSIISTYCCYFPFYEEIVLRRLLDRGCTNNILMVDSKMCALAFANEDNRPRRAGRDYTLVPVELDGAFHPKIIVTLGRSKGALFIGSHNTTLAGFGLNDEITNEFRTTGATARHGAVMIRSALDYLQGFAPRSLDEVNQVIQMARRNIPWLEGPMVLGSDDRGLLFTDGSGPDLWSRVRALVPKRISLAFVCGPFFDGKLQFLQQLLEDVKPRKLVVGIDPESVEIDPKAVEKFSKAEFVNIAGLVPAASRREQRASYLHAKILWFTGPDGDMLVTGSANPSKAAFLSRADRRNAEAIVVDRRVGVARMLGIDSLSSAPRLRDDEWAHVAQRRAERRDDESERAGTVILGVPLRDGFKLERPLNSRMQLDAFASDGTSLGKVITRSRDLTFIEATRELLYTAQTLRGSGTNNKPVVVLIHHEEVNKGIGGSRQAELRKALGGLEENPAQLDALLKLTEKVIFESDEIVFAEPPLRAKSNDKDQKASKAGPESFAVNAAGRRSARRKRRLASGDILVLLDLLIYRLGEGLSAAAAPRPPAEEVLPVAEDDMGEDEAPPVPLSYETLAEACRGKIGRLVRRMLRQLEPSNAQSARRAIVQLAAVLSVIQTLRIMEQRAEWRSKHLKLVDRKHEWELFEGASLTVTWGKSALRSRAVSENEDESFQELSLTIGLLGWLAWETEIDVRSAVERTTPFDIENEEEPWYAIQLFVTVAPSLWEDEDARSTFIDAVTRTARKGADASNWLKTHLDVASHLATIVRTPERIVDPPRPPVPGDLTVLGATEDPRLRVVLEAAPSGTSTKITVLDVEHENGERHFLASYVHYTPIMLGETVSKRKTAS